MTLAYVGIGSNLDGPREQVKRAFDELGKILRTQLIRKSSLYRSEPMGHANQPEFVNAVAELESELTPAELLAQLQEIEMRHGRRRSVPNAPRTLDLDLLLYGRETLVSEKLILPHPRMHQRRFVLDPLIEIAPELSIPGVGPVKERAAGCAGQFVERIGG